MVSVEGAAATFNYSEVGVVNRRQLNPGISPYKSRGIFRIPRQIKKSNYSFLWSPLFALLISFNLLCRTNWAQLSFSKSETKVFYILTRSHQTEENSTPTKQRKALRSFCTVLRSKDVNLATRCYPSEVHMETECLIVSEKDSRMSCLACASAFACEKNESLRRESLN